MNARRPSRWLAGIFLLCGLLLLYREFVLTYSTDGTYPIFGNIFKGCAGSNAAIGIANFRIIHVTAGFANVLFHKLFVFSVNNNV